MTIEYEDIKSRVDRAIQELYRQDHFLLEKYVSERSITHRLAMYLQPLFPEYHVDCEYNRNIEEGRGASKGISILATTAMSMFRERLEKRQLEEAILEVSTFPDIIIHRRGHNRENILIIEAKKNNSTIPNSYDEMKVKAFTGTENEPRYRYQWGLTILFPVGERLEAPSLVWYQNGEQKNA
jgi:hypothetical protein